MLMALPPDYLAKAIAGMEALAKNGLRYPFPQYGIQQDVRAGMAVSYPGRGADVDSGPAFAFFQHSAQSELPIEVFHRLALLARVRRSGKPGKIGRQQLHRRPVASAGRQ